MNPLPAKILDRYPLTKKGSTKETTHVALSVQNLPFKVGDSIGVFPENDEGLIEEILAITGDELIFDPRSKTKLLFSDFLLRKANLAKCSSSLLKIIPSAQTTLLLENKEKLRAFLELHHLIDILRIFPTPPPQELASVLLPLLPRFYSIASSPNQFPHEIHLAVATLSYSTMGGERRGVGSHFLCHQATDSTIIPIYLQPSNGFTLPSDPHASIILIGPGTGIAPFRAFLQERMHLNHPGRNWLFFGERHRATDFYYADDLLLLEQQGRLRLDLAFSRDTTQKVYVQHLLWEKRAVLWEWIQEGAFLYVCGDAQKMAKEVDEMLRKIIADQANLSEEAAREFTKTLRKEGRYLQDVY